MEEWSNAAEFEAIAARAVNQGAVRTYEGVTSTNLSYSPITSSQLSDAIIQMSNLVPSGKIYLDSSTNRMFVSEQPASPIRTEAGATKAPGKQEKPMSERNTKAFEIVYADDRPNEVVKAQTVTEADGRLTFHGYVEGVDDYNGTTVVKSIKADSVDEYRVVPKPELDVKVEGKHVYRVNLADGTTKDVKADHVLFQAGSGDKPGRYSLVTNVRGADSRTEYIVPEDKVDSVERLSDGVTLVDNTQADAADASA